MKTGLSRRTLLQLATVPALLSPAQGQAQGQDLAPAASRIYPGANGRLVYVPDEQGNTIHDASHAGYGGGGVAIPALPVRETIWPVAGDNTQHIQAAIDRVSALPRDRAGFRGAVLLRPGYHRLATPLRIQASGVVLRGEGMGDTGSVLIGTGTGRTASARAFRPGDTVIVRRIGNQAWIDAIGMNGDTPGSRWRPFNIEWDRTVVDVQGDTIALDAPLTCAIDRQWGGGDVTTYDDSGHIESLGRHVAPRSVYLAQLRERLGDGALRQVALASQIG